ncbi:quinone oxidoreductase [Ammoniphilus oxalaticus]|uniref:Quinone oxidoreductase n=1 Tax=Ammoniphilus oxalaticus TaxID=66863 RepID=A0A419SNL4_9BACL|nr:NADP-dependent oxidoreductase [Ammoniphilus oxalaticus]RKD25832.1 quinone oxidoreductase [Ammoniphilus oxalaticus]
MSKMKAFVRVDAKNDRVELAEVAIPEIDDNEALVEVKAFGVGVHDRYFIPQDASFPYTIGTEAAGIVAKTGKDVTDFKVGDRVILSSSLYPKGGCWAEYVAASPQVMVQMPDSMDFTLGASLPVAGKTALESIRALDLKQGDTLFVAGASGAIGTLVIQLAKARDIRVIGSASSKNHDYMKAQGALAAVDYRASNWKEDVLNWKPGGVDAALAIQRGTVKDSMDVVKDGGKVITVSGDDQVLAERGIFVHQFEHQLDIQQAVKILIEEINSGQLDVVLEQIYPFADAMSALEKTETRHARGKLVVSADA